MRAAEQEPTVAELDKSLQQVRQFLDGPMQDMSRVPNDPYAERHLVFFVHQIEALIDDQLTLMRLSSSSPEVEKQLRGMLGNKRSLYAMHVRNNWSGDADEFVKRFPDGLNRAAADRLAEIVRELPRPNDEMQK